MKRKHNCVSVYIKCLEKVHKKRRALSRLLIMAEISNTYNSGLQLNL